jgi:hypothetical protein
MTKRIHYVIFVGTLWKLVCAFALIAGLEINANVVFLMQLQEDDLFYNFYNISNYNKSKLQ